MVKVFLTVFIIGSFVFAERTLAGDEQIAPGCRCFKVGEKLEYGKMSECMEKAKISIVAVNYILRPGVLKIADADRKDIERIREFRFGGSGFRGKTTGNVTLEHGKVTELVCRISNDSGIDSEPGNKNESNRIKL